MCLVFFFSDEWKLGQLLWDNPTCSHFSVSVSQSCCICVEKSNVSFEPIFNKTRWKSSRLADRELNKSRLFKSCWGGSEAASRGSFFVSFGVILSFSVFPPRKSAFLNLRGESERRTEAYTFPLCTLVTDVMGSCNNSPLNNSHLGEQ